MARRVFHLEFDSDADRPKIETIRAALRFALDMNETYFAFAPKNRHSIHPVDYSSGNQRANERCAAITRELLDSELL